MKKITMILSLVISVFTGFSQSKRTVLTGEFSHLKDKDTVRLLVYRYGEFPYSIKELRESYDGVVREKQFKINIPLTDDLPYECLLVIPRLRISGDIIIIKRGDQLHISGSDVVINALTGKGAEKTNVLRKLNEIWNSPALKAAAAAPNASGASGLPLLITASQNAFAAGNNYLNTQRGRLDNHSFKMLKAYINGMISEIANTLYWYSNVGYSQAQKDSIQTVLKNVWLPFKKRAYSSPDVETSLSDFYFSKNLATDYALKQVIDHQNFNALKDNSDLKEKYIYFKTHYSGLVREKMITFLILSAPKSNDVGYCYDDAKKIITNNSFKAALDKYCQCIPGSPAYNFTLLDSNKVIHHLTDYKGKILVFDFWFTGCGNCRELTPKLREVESRYANNSKVVFISISSDKNFNLWKNSIRDGIYTTSPQEINLYTSGNGIADPLYYKTNTYSAPTLKLVDANGNWCENPIDCRFDNGKDLIGKIDRLLNN
ncbi:redoxin domain-containing protein [Mucilaginibacter mali]|uniref:Redoxin domain-containing protein n=1 Tax=Mucilaginibacter mali TaxID=2740462 RepID=A0A7D4Q7U6_9SPHI|nr:thioredoxin family protein [Mucilaginibacter mali]QKJ28404.1 redoxin domain-containing protein [Mucilaginibacter mali]